MIKTKEIFNTENGQEFISKEWLLRKANDEINTLARVCRDFALKDDEKQWKNAYHRLCSVMLAFREVKLVNTDSIDAMRDAIIHQRYGNEDALLIVPQINDDGDIYFV